MRPRVSAVAACALLALLPGCVSRKLFVRSEPAGATVWLDGRPVGVTPYEEEIPAWGTRRLELQAPGRQRLVADLPLETPWWDIWPIDMFSAVAPWTIRSDHSFAFTLQPAMEEDLSWDAAEATLKRVTATAERAAAGARP